MEKGGYIETLAGGTVFGPAVFAVRGVQVSDSGKGPRLTLTLADRTGRRVAKVWKASDGLVADLCAAPLARVSGTVAGATAGAYAGELTMTEIEPVYDPPDDLSPFLDPLPADHEDARRRFAALLASVRHRGLRRLLDRVFDPDGAVRARFEEAVAGKTLHHAYRGGLLRHTVEVAELCYKACAVLPFLRRDLLVTAALLHDVGKLWEMEQGLRAGTYTPLGALLGHIEDGAFRVRAAMNAVPEIPENLRLALTHLILAHHERPEYGSPKGPLLPEAAALALCDRLSAQATLYHDAALTAPPGRNTVWRGDREVYVGDIGWEEPSPDPAEDAPTPLPPGLALSPGEIAAAAFGTAAGGPPPCLLPVRGAVAAGDGAQSAVWEDLERRAVVPPPGGADFLLRVTGDSMTGAGILPGDLVFVRTVARPDEARDGQIVVAWVPGAGPVVKRLSRTGAAASLLSENPAYAPLPVTDGTVLQGRVVGLLRDF